MSLEVSDNAAPVKLGFVYIFGTSVEGIYKLGFTESSLNGRRRNHSNALGDAKIEAVAMTLDSRLQEGALFAEALRLCDRVKTFSTRKHFAACEIYFLSQEALAQLKNYFMIEIGQKPFHVECGSSKIRSVAIRKAMAFNNGLCGYSLDCRQLDKALRKTNNIVCL